MIYLASLRRCAVAERGGHMNARALPFAHLDESVGKQKRNAVRKEGRGVPNLQHAVGPALDQVAAGGELERAPVAAVLPKAGG